MAPLYARLGLLARIPYIAQIQRWAEKHWHSFLAPLGFKRNKPPTDTAISRILAKASLEEHSHWGAGVGSGIRNPIPPPNLPSQHGCDYLFQLKENQGDAHEAVVYCFKDAETTEPDHISYGKKGATLTFANSGVTLIPSNIFTIPPEKPVNLPGLTEIKPGRSTAPMPTHPFPAILAVRDRFQKFSLKINFPNFNFERVLQRKKFF